MWGFPVNPPEEIKAQRQKQANSNQVDVVDNGVIIWSNMRANEATLSTTNQSRGHCCYSVMADMNNDHLCLFSSLCAPVLLPWKRSIWIKYFKSRVVQGLRWSWQGQLETKGGEKRSRMENNEVEKKNGAKQITPNLCENILVHWPNRQNCNKSENGFRHAANKPQTWSHGRL